MRLNTLRRLQVAALAALIGIGIGGSAPGFAQEGSDEDFDEGSVTSGQHRGATQNASRRDDVETYTPRFVPEDMEKISIVEADARPFPTVVYVGAHALGLDPSFINDCYVGLEYIYQRNYKAAKSHWDDVQVRYPGRGVGHFGNMMIYQSLMLENFDYRYEQQYQFHSQYALEELEASLKQPGDEAWEYFLIGGAMGIESIHTMRKGDFVPALARGLDAMNYVNKVKELAPMFPDPVLGDGLYRYWRSVVTMNSKVLPDMGDDREEGIADMVAAEHEAIFVRPAATMALAFTWIEERDFSKALQYCMKNNRAYPDNVINNLLTGRVYMYKRQYEKAQGVFDAVIASEPDNMRVYYYKSVVSIRQRDYDAADAAIDRYLSFDLEDEFRAAAYYRKGQIAYFRQDYGDAEGYFKEAVKINGHKPSKAKIAHMKKTKKR